MPIIIKRPDLEPKHEVYEYDKIVGVIVLVFVGLWIVADILGILLLGTIEGFVVKYAPELKEDVAEINDPGRARLCSRRSVSAHGTSLGHRHPKTASNTVSGWCIPPRSRSDRQQAPTDETLFAESGVCIGSDGLLQLAVVRSNRPKPH